MTRVTLTILGQPCSKANSRQIVTIGDRPKPIKSKEAIAYERDALKQIPPRARLRLEGPVRVTLRLFYASERPDLDESIVLDVMQDRWGKRPGDGIDGEKRERPLLQAGIYRNDRQVREKHVYHGIDKANPRAEVIVEPVTAQQLGLLTAQAAVTPERLLVEIEEALRDMSAADLERVLQMWRRLSVPA